MLVEKVELSDLFVARYPIQEKGELHATFMRKIKSTQVNYRKE
jgi:hypothetical protein